ncbi:MAG: efflux RND transporter periplasmic adaptor subunit [Nitrospira sp.]|nr:efflux RND transporter periplasmic adaptor subunit [Nitrospira sp.]
MTSGSRLLLSGMIICAWLVIPTLIETADAKTDFKPSSSAAELSTIRGVVKATAQATLASQVQGRISRLPFKEGQRFKKGALLVALDCSKYEAELASAQAEHRGKKKTHENNLHLAKHQAVGTLEVEISEADADKAFAAVQAARVNVNGCTVRAPFPGRVVKTIVNEHENVFPNDQLISLLDDSLLEIELILPSKSLAWLKIGTPFEYAVDETGLRYSAVVQDLGANVDPASQTVKVKGLFRVQPDNVLAGMSGTASFDELSH